MPSIASPAPVAPVATDAEPTSAPTHEAVRARLHAEDAVIIAHYYTEGVIQDLAEATGGFVGDSLEMARFGTRVEATTLVVVGVRFMGETAKILNPEKRVLVPDRGATCSLDEGCPAEAFRAFRAAYPGRTALVYANTSAAVKAEADWVVTSSIAPRVVRYLHGRGEPLLWAPDRYLGAYLREQTGADLVLWPGSCIVHEAFKAEALAEMRTAHPEACVLVHPESPAEVIAQADVVGSTTQLIEAAATRAADTFIVATDNGILHRMRQVAPDKTFWEAPTAGAGATCRSCAHCPWMAMNTLDNLHACLVAGQDEIVIEEGVRARAAQSVQRMLDFAAGRYA